jgi:hypothetical protein
MPLDEDVQERYLNAGVYELWKHGGTCSWDGVTIFDMLHMKILML